MTKNIHFMQVENYSKKIRVMVTLFHFSRGYSQKMEIKIIERGGVAKVRNFKRVMSVLLVIVMILSTLPLNALAQGLTNTNAKEQLIAALSEQYGPETAEAMCESMIDMGIIDKDGNRLTYKIEMDGELYTLDQMRDIVNAPDVDLAKEVKVDDKVVTLDFIAKLIDFEAYIKFVEDNFLKNNVPVTDEHLEMLEDLESQLNTEGISLMQGTPDTVSRKRSIPEPTPVALVEYT